MKRRRRILRAERAPAKAKNGQEWQRKSQSETDGCSPTTPSGATTLWSASLSPGPRKEGEGEAVGKTGAKNRVDGPERIG